MYLMLLRCNNKWCNIVKCKVQNSSMEIHMYVNTYVIVHIKSLIQTLS